MVAKPLSEGGVELLDVIFRKVGAIHVGLEE